MPADCQRIDLKRELLRIHRRAKVASLPGFVHGAAKREQPFLHGLNDALAHRARPAVKFERCSREETSAFKDAGFHVFQPVFAKRPQPRHPCGLGQCRANHVSDENLPRHLHRSQLQLFLGAEVGEQAALAHFELIRQAADGQALQPFHRGQIDSRAQDAFPRARSFGHALPGLR